MKEKLINLTALSQFKNKILELIPTKTSQLTNDKAFVTNTDLEIQVNEINENINNLGESVADGKALIASAITNKGVSTSPEAAFADMANAIASIVAGKDNDSNTDFELVDLYNISSLTDINTENLVCIIDYFFALSSIRDVVFTSNCKNAKSFTDYILKDSFSINSKKIYIGGAVYCYTGFTDNITRISHNINVTDTYQVNGTFGVRRKTKQ